MSASRGWSIPLRRLATFALLFVGAYALVAGAILGIGIAVDAGYSQTVTDLVDRGVHWTGTVTSLQPHNGVCYRYNVAGMSYAACHRASYPGEQTLDLAIGNSIDMYYDPTNPSVSCACDPKEEADSLQRDHFAFAGVAAVLPAYILVVVVVERWFR